MNKSGVICVFSHVLHLCQLLPAVCSGLNEHLNSTDVTGNKVHVVFYS